jgi:ribonuclease HI
MAPVKEIPLDKSINILIWNVGADVNRAPHYSILCSALRVHRADVAFLQEFRNVGILRPLWRLRPVAIWPSITAIVGGNTAPHVYGGSLIASRLGYLSKNAYSSLGSIEFNSVAVKDGLHFVNVYLPCIPTALHEGARDIFDGTHFLDHIRFLISGIGSSVLIAGDFNSDLNNIQTRRDNLRSQILLRLIDEGFQVMNPTDSNGRFLDTHFSSSSKIKTGSAIDVVLWRGPMGRLHPVHSLLVRRLQMHHRDHYGLLVRLNGAFSRPKQNTPKAAFSAFAKCLDTAPPSEPSSPLSPSGIDCQSAHDLWSSITPNQLTEETISQAVASWHKAKTRRELRDDPLFSRYFAVTTSMIAMRESILGARSPRVITRLYSQLRDASFNHRKLRQTIADRSRFDHFKVCTPLLTSGQDNFVRNFLLRALRAPGKCLDLSALSPEEFERFRCFYSECWDPPDTPSPDLSFLDDGAPLVPLLPNAVEHDITAPCDETELLEALSTLHLGKAPGPSQVTVDLYKIAQTHPDISEFLLSVVNQCLEGNRPKSLDDCRLVLIYKKGDRSIPSNWRPINLTNAAFRVCEAVIRLRLLDWSELVLSDNAFGFRRRRGAEQVGYLLASKLYRANRLRRPIHLVTLDIAKAFDTVPHDKLLLSLVRVGLSLASVRIIACMVLGHTSTVGDPSDRHFTIRICRGVLQGGILSPILFNIFFDQGLPTEIPDILPLGYADDVSGLHIGAAPPDERSTDTTEHHTLVWQQWDAVRSQRPEHSQHHADVDKDVPALPLDSSSDSDDDGMDASLALPLQYRRLMLQADDDVVPRASEARDLLCRIRVNTWLSERDQWLRENSMRHNASKSEAAVFNCSTRVAIKLPDSPISVLRSVTILGLRPELDGFCSRPDAKHSGQEAARLFSSAWLRLRHYVTLRDLRCLLMAFIYSHEVFGSCLQNFSARRPAYSPMSRCIRSAVSCHYSVNVDSLFEFLGMVTPRIRITLLRLNFLMRCLNPLCPPLVQDEFLHHRMEQPWFKTLLRALAALPQPKCGLPLCDRLERCIEGIGEDDEDDPLPDFFTHPPPDDFHAVLVTDGSSVLDEGSSAGPSGWGYVLFYKGRTYTACGYLHYSSSGTAEAMACFHGLRHCQQLGAAFVHLRTDNQSCKGLLDGTRFPDNIGCMRLYLYLCEIDFQLHCYKVYSHSATEHRDILNDAADALAARGRSGESLAECSPTTQEHTLFLARPIPRDNPGKEGEQPPPPQVLSKQETFLSEFRLAVCSSLRASQMLSQVKFLKGDVRWMNFPGVPPAIVLAKVMRQHYLYHLRYDLQEHLSHHPSLSSLCTPCPLCGSEDNSTVHRAFRCTAVLASTQDALNFLGHQLSLQRYRAHFTSLLPVDDFGTIIPRSDSAYLLWLSCSNLVIEDGASVRHLTESEMQLLADASYSLHALYIKYSLISAHEHQDHDAPRAPVQSQSRTASDADCITIAHRLDQCRSYMEVRSWYCWQGYGQSTTYAHLSRVIDRTGRSFLQLRTLLLKLEVLLAACLCAHSEARLSILASYFSKPTHCITYRLYSILREGNPLNIPVTAHNHSERPISAHLDMPDFVYSLPFDFLNSSILVEAWFAAPSLRERRELITWPPFIDTSSKYNLPIDRVWSYEELGTRADLWRRTGSGNCKTPRLQLHPNLQYIYVLLRQAIRHDNVRVKWRVRYSLILQKASSTSSKFEIRRRLLISLILGDTRDLLNYQPPGTVFPYNVTSTVEEVLCVPVCRQSISISTLPGFSLPPRGPHPRLPSQSVFERVRSQIASHRATLAAPGGCLHLATTAMAEQATIWAREWIESTRDSICPDPAYFPPLERPATHPPDDVDTLFPALQRDRPFFEDGEDAAPSPGSSSQNSEH